MSSISVSHQKGRHPDFFVEILDGFTEWLTRLNYGAETIKSRTYQLGYFFNWLSEREITRLVDITKPDLEAYSDHLHRRPIGAQTIQDYLCTLKRLNTYLESYGHAPVVKIRLQVEKDLSIERTILTIAEINHLFEACDDTIYGMRDRVLLALFYGCGLRCREGNTMELCDVDLADGLVHVRKGKNYRERYVPISMGVKRIFVDWLDHGHQLFTGGLTNVLLPSINGKIWRNGGINQRLQKLCDKAKITKHISLHCLRHSIATHLLLGGMDLENISLFLGHQGLEATKIYTHLVSSWANTPEKC